MQPLANVATNTAAAAQLGYDIAIAEQKVQKSPLLNGMPFIILNGEIKYVSEEFAAPSRMTGTVKLNDAKSFLLAWARNHCDDSLIYGSLTPGQFTAVFNDHGDATGEPGFRDHRAEYTLSYSEEWSAWTAHSGMTKAFPNQEDFGYFIEDHAPDIIDPTAAEMLEIALNFRATTNGQFKNSVSLQSGKVHLEYAKNIDASAEVNRGGALVKLDIPEQFSISIPVFAGIDQPIYKIDARFRFRVSGGGIKIWYDLIQPHKVAELAFKDIWQKIETESGVEVLLGTP